MTDATAQPSVHELPPERVGRGLLFSLAVIPVGVVVWVLISFTGWITAIVAFGVAAGAVWLYRKGSGGRITLRGVIVIVAVTLATLVLALLAAFAWNEATGLAEGTDFSTVDVLMEPAFWVEFGVFLPEIIGANIINVLLALLFGVLGAFGTLRSVFAEAKAAPPAAYSFPLTQEAPAAQFGTAPAVTPDLDAIPAYEVPPAAAAPTDEPTAPPAPETDPRV